MMVQLPLKFPTEFYIAHATSNMNKYYAPLPRSSTDHQSISCKTPRSFNFPVLSSSPVRNNNNSGSGSSNSNGKKPWFRPYCIFPRILIHKVRTSESGPSSSSSSSSSKYRLTACFYKKNIPCRGKEAPYMKPADIAVSISQAKSESFESTDSSLGELQPILTNVSMTKTSEGDGSDHESRWDYLEDPSDDMLDDIDRKMAGICMEERNIHIENNNNKDIKHVDNNGDVQGMDTEEANIAGDGKFKHDEIKLVNVSNGEFAQDVTGLSVIVSGVNISNGEVSNEHAFIDMLIKGEIENADNDMEKNSDGEFELNIFKPSIIDSSKNIKRGEIAIGGRVSNGQLEEPLEINREIEHAISNMDEKSSRISNEEYFELDFSRLSILHGNVPENNMMDCIIKKDDYKSNIMDQMKECRLNSIKKHVEVSSALGHSRRLFVAKKLKDSAKRRLLVLFKPRKHKTKKKVIVLTTTITDEGSETFWSKPILRGKRCRELPVEEFLYSNHIRTAGACGGGGGRDDDGVLV